ncbi:MAG: hypothetical protein LBK70_02515 [Clostridiales bacterium]|jgi:hypothetical protein|nr:hypothetical protein [Clostridiales bacterium]
MMIVDNDNSTQIQIQEDPNGKHVVMNQKPYQNTKRLLWIVCIAWLMVLIALPLLYFVGYVNAKDKYAKDKYAIKANRYNIVTTFASLPPLYAVLANLDHNEPVYVYNDRVNTFDIDKMPSNWHKIIDFGLSSGEDGMRQVAEATLQLVQNIIRYNPQATFRYYVDDLRVLLPLYVFETAGISMDRVSIVMLSDGTYSYNSALTKFLGQDGVDNWSVVYQELNDYIAKFRNGDELTQQDYNKMWLGWDFAYPASALDNVTYWLQFPEYLYLHSDMSSDMLSQFLRLNIFKQQPYSLLNNLSFDAKDIFFDVTINNKANQVDGQDLRQILDEYFVSDDGMPVMIISGTNPNPSTFVADGGIVDTLIEMYSANYQLMFKPHPAYTADNDALQAKGIISLPAQLPMEVLMMAYPNIRIGGFGSTLYMSTRSEQVAFFIGSLAAPLDWLAGHGFFDQAVFV